MIKCRSKENICAVLSHVNSFVTPRSSVHGILQARILERVAILSSRGSFWPRDWTLTSCISYIGKWILLLLPTVSPGKSQREHSHPQKESNLKRNQPCPYLHQGLLAPSKKQMSAATESVMFVTATPGNESPSPHLTQCRFTYTSEAVYK